MRVGVISDWINGGNYAGIANYVYHLLKELININRESIYLINYEENESTAEYNKIIIYNPFKRISKTILWYLYLGTQSNHLKRLDIIHNPTQGSTFFRFKQKYILTVHDITVFIVPKEHPVYRILFGKLLFPRTLKTADKIITDSNSTKKDLINYFNIPEEKIKVIFLGVDEKFKPLDKEEINEVKQRYNLNFPFILYVGTLEPRKNIPTLIKAFYKLKKKNIEHKLVITGKKGWKYKKIFETIDKLNLQKNVTFTGYVSDEDLPALYNTADLFVYPSLYEGFGFPPLEAMACGTPVITSNTSSLPEVVGDAGIMVNPYDVDGLADAMHEVLTNDGLREDMIKKGLERAKMFSWEKCARETLRVYEEVYNER
ncbi:MAG TPA: glycosyltransferase family 1 protein [Desulfotomaculum sp.]|nr:glycosyltransferase family 1 protein [Desulfotomaculum sp.]